MRQANLPGGASTETKELQYLCVLFGKSCFRNFKVNCNRGI